MVRSYTADEDKKKRYFELAKKDQGRFLGGQQQQSKQMKNDIVEERR
jgi:hypothetical protein